MAALQSPMRVRLLILQPCRCQPICEILPISKKFYFSKAKKGNHMAPAIEEVVARLDQLREGLVEMRGYL